MSHKKYQEASQNCLSFPVRNHDYSHLGSFLKHYLNNHGDPFHTDSNAARAREFEREVL